MADMTLDVLSTEDATSAANSESSTRRARDYAPLAIIVSAEMLNSFSVVGVRFEGLVNIFIYKNGKTKRHINVDDTGQTYQHNRVNNTFSKIDAATAVRWANS